jgi:phosphatidylserine decarboxylase
LFVLYIETATSAGRSTAPVPDTGNVMKNAYQWVEPPRMLAFPIARPGYPLIAAAAFMTLVFALLEWAAPALVGMLATGWICWFFRDPNRVVPTAAGVVVAPADGRVIVSETVDDQPLYGGRCRQISIFMSVFNVHVNRVPFSGVVRAVDYRPGGFRCADHARASGENERNAVVLETDGGQRVCFVQVAGKIARRILSRLQVDDQAQRGERFGMICFGSRMDVYLPADAVVQVDVGDRVQAGTSILGSMP